jgi:hypothetical protein
MSTLKLITAKAKQIRAKRPTMKWTDAIKAASKELKASGKIAPKKTTAKRKTTVKRPASKVGAVTSIKLLKSNLDSTQTKYKHKGRYYNINDDQDGDFYIMVAGKAVYFKKPYPKMGAVSKPKTMSKAKPVSRAKKVAGSHTDTKSHNVRINVLSGVRPAQLVLNGVGRLVKNKYYTYNGKDIYPIVGLKGATTWKGSLLKYLGVKNNSLLFDIRFKLKSKAGFDTITERWELPRTMAASSFIPTKKPTVKELAIGHLKMY